MWICVFGAFFDDCLVVQLEEAVDEVVVGEEVALVHLADDVACALQHIALDAAVQQFVVDLGADLYSLPAHLILHVECHADLFHLPAALEDTHCLVVFMLVVRGLVDLRASLE